jgi:hypothetical protein
MLIIRHGKKVVKIKKKVYKKKSNTTIRQTNKA